MPATSNPVKRYTAAQVGEMSTYLIGVGKSKIVDINAVKALIEAAPDLDPNAKKTGFEALDEAKQNGVVSLTINQLAIFQTGRDSVGQRAQLNVSAGLLALSEVLSPRALCKVSKIEPSGIAYSLGAFVFCAHP